MATIVERPQSIVRNSPVDLHPRMPQRMQREPSVEIIDVDLLHTPRTDAPQRPGISRPADVITLDSDSDNEGLMPPVQRRRRSFYSPPPPAPTPERVPPMPRLPTALDSFASFPRRRMAARTRTPHAVPPTDTSGVIRANDSDPLSRFAATGSNDRTGAFHVTSHHPPIPGPSRPIRTVPLGGGLISQQRARRRGRAPAAIRFIDEDDEPAMDIRYLRNRIPPLVGVMRPFSLSRFATDFYVQNGWAGAGATWPGLAEPLAREEEDYEAKYTHPKPAEASYSHDFAPVATPTNALASTSKSNPIIIDDDEVRQEDPPPATSTVLVCAHCLAPLVSGAVSKEAKVWGLRCGHIIDGNCLEKLAYPIPLLGEDDDLKGKGEGKARRDEDIGESGTSVEGGEESNGDDHDETDEMPGTFGLSPMRARLRSHRTQEPEQEQSSVWSVLTSALPLLYPSRARGTANATSTGRRSSTTLGKRKRSKKGRPPPKPKIQETHSWNCPVTNCGREHFSLKMDGVWMQATETNQLESGNRKGKAKVQVKLEGAVGLFV